MIQMQHSNCPVKFQPGREWHVGAEPKSREQRVPTRPDCNWVELGPGGEVGEGRTGGGGGGGGGGGENGGRVGGLVGKSVVGGLGPRIQF